MYMEGPKQGEWDAPRGRGNEAGDAVGGRGQEPADGVPQEGGKLPVYRCVVGVGVGGEGGRPRARVMSEPRLLLPVPHDDTCSWQTPQARIDPLRTYWVVVAWDRGVGCACRCVPVACLYI